MCGGRRYGEVGGRPKQLVDLPGSEVVGAGYEQSEKLHLKCGTAVLTALTCCAAITTMAACESE